jgi:hypothetical protein
VDLGLGQRVKKLSVIIFITSLSLCACIKPPDDGMALGEETSFDAVERAKNDSQTMIPQEKYFRVGDYGVINEIQTVFSSSQVLETFIWKIRSADTRYYYIDLTAVKKNVTKNYILEKAVPASTPTPSPTPAPTPTAVTKKSELLKKFDLVMANLKSRVLNFVGKVSIQASTALGQTDDTNDPGSGTLSIQAQLFTSLTEFAGAQSAGAPAGHRYYGLQVINHAYPTSNCSQLKDCKANSTHVEYNEVFTGDDGKQIQVHWVYEISKDLPGLFQVISSCGSAVKIIKNSQIPFMECQTLDTFQFGSGTN